MRKIFALLLLALVGFGCGGIDTTTASPLGLVDGPIRVATYNIHHWEGNDGKKDIHRIANVIDRLQTDILIVQEADNKVEPDEHWGRQERVANMLRGSWVPFDSEDGFTVHRNAIFVAPHVDILESEYTDVSEEGRDPRAFVETKLAVRGINLRVIGAHLGLDLDERKRQVSQIERRLQERDTDVHGTIFAGDLNEWNPFAKTFSPLKAHLHSADSGGTFPARRPVFRLDRIWVSEHGAFESVRVVKGELQESASDHLPLLAEIVF